VKCDGGLGVTFKYKDHHLIEGHTRTPQRVGGFVLSASKTGRQLAAPPFRATGMFV
jgi:hypothetical protein